MKEEMTTTQDITIETVVPAATVATGSVAVAEEGKPTSTAKLGRGGRGKPMRGGRPRAPREKPEFDSRTISIRRVTRVVSGGRRFTLSVAVAAGDRNGRIGLGTGKAMDTQVAVEKAIKAAKRNMLTLKLSKTKSLPHDISAKFGSAKVMVMPNKGKGLIAGSSARIILSLAGLNNVTAKFHSGTKNKLNNARATMKALAQVAYAYGEAPVQATNPLPSESKESK